jgi:hypothetical protein
MFSSQGFAVFTFTFLLSLSLLLSLVLSAVDDEILQWEESASVEVIHQNFMTMEINIFTFLFYSVTKISFNCTFFTVTVKYSTKI